MAQPFHICGAAADSILSHGLTGLSLIRYMLQRVLGAGVTQKAENALVVWNLGNVIVPQLVRILRAARRITCLFTSAVTISMYDELYSEFNNWLTMREAQRMLVTEYNARSITPDPYSAQMKDRLMLSLGPSGNDSEETQVELTPICRTTWFFHGWNIFTVLRSTVPEPSETADRGMRAEIGRQLFGKAKMETVTITCLGWSMAPIQGLLKSCREAHKSRESTNVVIRTVHNGMWTWTVRKPARLLETICLDENIKRNLLQDITQYLDPNRRRFYVRHGIPYRRGYLLHGPPGCGKSSLSLALAGHFGLDLYVMNPSTVTDSQISNLFTLLPSRCFVLIEDIDAVSVARKYEGRDNGMHNDNSNIKSSRPVYQRCSLSTLLNVLDGVESQEGRVVIMTSNFPERLDKALIRPGRIDLRVFMGHITQKGAEDMFIRMMKTARIDRNPSKYQSERESRDITNLGMEELSDDALLALAREFALQVPEQTLTPAQLQGFLLEHLGSAKMAAEKIGPWIADVTRQVQEEATGGGTQNMTELNKTTAVAPILTSSVLVPLQPQQKKRMVDAILAAGALPRHYNFEMPGARHNTPYPRSPTSDIPVAAWLPNNGNSDNDSDGGYH